MGQLKKRWIFWWIVNAFWLIIFFGLSLIIWLRKVDGAGVVQTPELKLFAFAILLIAFAFPALKQIIWLVINIVTTKDERTKQLT